MSTNSPIKPPLWVFTIPTLFTTLRFILTPLMLFVWFSEKSLQNEIVKITVVIAIYISATLTDYYDGYYARKLNQQTKLGSFLDPLADKILLLSVFIAFLFVESFQLFNSLIWLIVLREVGITILRVFFVAKDKNMTTDYHGKLKTVSQIVAQGILFALLLFNSIIYQAYALNEKISKPFSQISFDTLKPYYQAPDKLGLPESFILILKWLPCVMVLLATLFTLISGILYLYTNRRIILPARCFHDKDFS